jgi:hypothetical protein
MVTVVAVSTYDRLKAQNRVLRAALDLSADPESIAKRLTLEEALADPALPSNDLGAAIEKALRRPAPVNLLKRDRAAEVAKSKNAPKHDLTEGIRKRREEFLQAKADEPRLQQERRERIAKGGRG